MSAQPGQLDHGGHGHQRLVGTDVGERPLPADVLFPGPQRGDVGRPPDPSNVRPTRRPGRRRTCWLATANMPRYGPPNASGRAQWLALGHRHVRPLFPRRPQKPGRHRVEGSRPAAPRPGSLPPWPGRGSRCSRGSWGEAATRPPVGRPAGSLGRAPASQAVLPSTRGTPPVRRPCRPSASPVPDASAG